LLYAGRHSAEKNLESLKPVLQAFPHARLALVGDGPHRKTLEQHFAGMPVTMAGFLHGEELAAAYASSDVFVMPSRTETLGLVVLEAMSSALPVVAARAGGIPDMIQHGVNGFLFDTEAQAIAAVGELLESSQKRRAIGDAARAHAAQVSWNAATLQLAEHYKQACEIQHAATHPAHGANPPTVRARINGTLRGSTMSAIRRLLP